MNVPSGKDSGGRVAGRLRAARTGSFVGRQTELDLFRSALGADVPPFAVLAVHGPGGVGKSALLGRYAQLADDSGRPVLLVDGRDIDPSPAGIRQAIADQLQVPADQAETALADLDGPVLLVDTYEDLARIDDWIRARLIPILSDRTLVVLAGRQPPGAGWHRDPGWDQLLRTVALRDLPADQARTLLRLRGVDPARHDQALALVRGHPLALVLLADVIDQHDPAPLTLGHAPEVLEGLLDRLARNLPDQHHRDALYATAIAGTATESLLRDVIGHPHARPLFDWLATLSFTHPTPTGITMHDLASDTLAAELRWRDPDHHRQIHQLVIHHLQTRAIEATGPAQDQAMLDVVRLHRHHPVMRPFVSTGAGIWMEPATPDDHDTILALTRRCEGDTTAEVAEDWLERQPDAFRVFRTADSDVPIGFVSDVAVTDDRNRDRDPVQAAAWGHVRAHGPVRQGEHLRLMRCWTLPEAHDHFDVLGLALAAGNVDYLIDTMMAWAVVVVTDPDVYKPLFTFAGFHRIPGEIDLDRRSVVLFARDMRQTSIREWWNLIEERMLADDGAAGPLPQPERRRLVLEHEDFADAVRDALKHLTRPDRLADNPLLHSRVVLDLTDHDQPATKVLVDLVHHAADELTGHPRDDKHRRTIDRTYLRPAPTQEAAAEVLDLPFSTYRRHLAAGIDHITNWLWTRELHGHPDQDPTP